MTKTEMQAESLTRAENGASEANYPAIYAGFEAMGIARHDIRPRENVFTFGAWLAKGRMVVKGQHGVKVQTVIEGEEELDDEKTRRFKVPKTTTVFHVSQTTEAKPPNRTRKEAPVVIEGPTRIPERYRLFAEKLQPKIDQATRPMSQNPTPKRNRDYMARLHEGRNMMRTQKALRAIADAIDAATLPPILRETITRDGSGIARMVYKGRNSSRESYYTVVEADDYTDTDPAARTLQAMIAGESVQDMRRLKIQELEAKVKLMDIPGFFPTPAPLVQMMIELAEIEPHHSVLEPSAGSGAIADAIAQACPTVELDVCELRPKLGELLKLKGYNYVFQYPDFMELPAPSQDSIRYDRVVMNPPFENGQDMDHVMHAYSMLKRDGVLVAVMSPHFEFAKDHLSIGFRKWIELVGGSWLEIPAGAFKQSNTGVSSRLLVIDKREEN